MELESSSRVGRRPPCCHVFEQDAESWVCHVITVTKERWEGMQQSFATVYKDLHISQSNLNLFVRAPGCDYCGRTCNKKLSSATKHFHLSHLKLSSLFFKQWMLSQFRICDFIPVCNLSHNVLRNFIKMYFWVHLKEKVSPCLQCTCQINWMQLKVTD